jgi:hypothetical protein
MWQNESGFTVNHGTHTLHLGIAARGSTKISELFAFECLDAYDAPIDVVIKNSPTKLEVL